MTINVRVRDGMCPDPTTGDGGATEGDIRGSFSDIIDVVGVKDLSGGHCLVTQNSPAAMSVLVAPGVVYIPNADYDELDSNQVKFWEAVITVSTAVTITANTSGSTRIDLICAKMDTTITPDEHASNIATLVAVAGTPGAGVPATPDNYAKLAEVEVANGASTIVTADITDSRVQAKINSDYIPDIETGILTETHYAPQGFLINGKIVPSVNSNNLTVAIKGMDGNDPSVSNPVYCRIGDIVRTITSALSVTKNAGTSWFNAGSSELATKEVDYFVYLGYNATDGVVLGFSRIPFGKIYSDFSTTNTDEKFCAISTITNAAAGDAYENIGRFAATLSAGAGYTWTVPTFTNKNLIQKPVYETRLLDYVPTHTGTSAYTNAPTTNAAKYQIMNNRLSIFVDFTYNAISGGGDYSKLTMPFAPLLTLEIWYGNNVTAGIVSSVQTTPTTVYVYKYDGTTPIVNSNQMIIKGIYFI